VRRGGWCGGIEGLRGFMLGNEYSSCIHRRDVRVRCMCEIVMYLFQMYL
jgi:hypothetical protein